MAMKPLERDIQKSITHWLTLRGIFFYRQNSGAMSGKHKGKRWFVRFAKPGAPDLVVVHGGRYIGIEVKRFGYRQTEKQTAFMDDLRKAGGLYILAYCLEDVIKAMQEIEFPELWPEARSER